MMRSLILTASLVAALASAASAATVNSAVSPAASPPKSAQAATAAGDSDRPRRLGQFQSWDVYTYLDKGTKVCYAISKPTKTDPSIKRNEVQALVTHRVGGPYNVVNFVSGYGFKPDSSASVNVDTKSFDFFTKDDGAWSRDASTDKSVVDTMNRGRVVLVKGTPAKGKETTDSYSLTGFPRALAAIDKACSVKR